MSVPLVPKSSTKRLIIPATDFAVPGLPAMGSSIFSDAASTSVRTRVLFEMLPVLFHCVWLFLFPGSLTWLYWVQHVTAPISSIVGTMPQLAQGLVKDVPPASRRPHSCRMQVSSSLAAMWWRMACFWWQLTYNITVHIVRLSLKNSCFCDQYAKDPIPCWLPYGNSLEIRVLWKQGIRLLIFLLLNLETSQCPSGPGLRKLPCLSVLMVSTHRPVT